MRNASGCVGSSPDSFSDSQTNFLGTTLLFSSLIPIAPPLWVTNVLVSLNVLLPLTGRARRRAPSRSRYRFRRRSRALVYAALTTMLAGVFGVLDWLFGSTLEELRLITPRRSCDRDFDRVRIRLLTRAHRARGRGGLLSEASRRRSAPRSARARSPGRALAPAHRARALVSEVVDAFGLTSAASLSAYGREAPTRRSCGPRRTVGATRKMHRSTMKTSSCSRCGRANAPSISRNFRGGATTCRSARTLRSSAFRSTRARGSPGLVLYGGHPDGSDVDPSEVAQLERLVGAASVALDALDAERLRADIDAKASRVDELEARLDELRHVQAAETLTLPEGARPVEGIL